MPDKLLTRVWRDGNTVHVLPASYMGRFIRGPFWVSYDLASIGAGQFDLAELGPAIWQIPYILNVAPIAWVSGRHFEIDEMESDLFHSLERVRRVLRQFYPSTAWDGTIRPHRLVRHPNRKTKEGFVTLYSAGVDSSYSALSLASKRKVLLSVLGNDLSLDNEVGWQRMQALALRFGRLAAAKPVFVRSNFRSLDYDRLSDESGIIGWWGRVQHALAFIGLALPVALLAGLRTVVIASGSTREFTYSWGSRPAESPPGIWQRL